MAASVIFDVDVLDVIMDGTPRGVIRWCSSRFCSKSITSEHFLENMSPKYTIMAARASGLVNPMTTQPAYPLVHTHGCRKIGAW
jgi:hypothetical protein